MSSAAVAKSHQPHQSAQLPVFHDQQFTRDYLRSGVLSVDYLRRVLPYPSWKRNPKAWMYFAGHLRTVYRRQISRWRNGGLLNAKQAERLTACNTPKATWHCGHISCPWCWFRRFLYLFRIIWSHAVKPALIERRIAHRNKKPRTRLAVGVVEDVVTEPGEVEPRFQQLIREERVIRKIQRAGRIDDGVACTHITPFRQDDGRVAYRLHIAVLGLTDRSVQLEDPQPRQPASWRIRWTAGVKKNTPDLPQLGPHTLIRLLFRAFPFPAEYLDCSLPTEAFSELLTLEYERVRALGEWRDFIKARPSKFPKPVQELSPKKIKLSAAELRDARWNTQASLRSMNGCVRVGETIEQALDRPHHFNPAFRYAVLSKEGIATSDELRDEAFNWCLHNPADFESLRAILPADFVQAVNSDYARRAMASIRQSRRQRGWDVENGEQRRHYVSIRLVKSLGMNPIGIAKLKEELGAEPFLQPIYVCEELGLPLRVVGSRSYELELEGGFAGLDDLRTQEINDADWRPLTSNDRVTLPLAKLYGDSYENAQRIQAREEHLVPNVRSRRRAAGKPAWVAVVFHPYWSKNLQVVHNFEAVEQLQPNQLTRIRTRSDQPLYIQEFSEFLKLLPDGLKSAMAAWEYDQFSAYCKEYGR